MDGVLHFLVPHIDTNNKWDGNLTSPKGKEKQKSPSKEKSSDDEAAYLEEESEFTKGCVWRAEEVASLKEK